jgi:hypothetical protein
MRLDGTEVVVLSPDAYERLDALRRQVGAHSNRARAPAAADRGHRNSGRDQAGG